MSTWKYSIILGFLDQLKDRFGLYGETRNLDEKFELASKIEGLEGLELVYPFEFKDVQKTRQLLDQYNLQCSAVNVNIKTEGKFHHGALTSRDPGIRNEAVEYIKSGMNIAAEIGANMITMCPLADGYDYPFETDYIKTWRCFIDGIGEAASHRPDVKLSLEYKQSEPRHKVIIPNAGTTLAALQQINLPNVGATVDMGHALLAGESTSQAVSLLAQASKLFIIHVNDNYRNWDWDMIPGSINPWDLVEMMFFLGEIDYRGWLTSDVAPFRTDPIKTFSATYHSLLWSENLVDRIGRDRLRGIIQNGDSIDALLELQKFV